jgi:hypothetical protein
MANWQTKDNHDPNYEVEILATDGRDENPFRTSFISIGRIRQIGRRRRPNLGNISDRDIYESLMSQDIDKRHKLISMAFYPFPPESQGGRSRSISDCYPSTSQQWTDPAGRVHKGRGTGHYPWGTVFMYQSDDGYCCDAEIAAGNSDSCEALWEQRGMFCHGNSCDGYCPQLESTDEGIVVMGGCSMGFGGLQAVRDYADTSCCPGCPQSGGFYPCPWQEGTSSDPYAAPYPSGTAGQAQYINYAFPVGRAYGSMFNECADEDCANFMMSGACQAASCQWLNNACECGASIWGGGQTGETLYHAYFDAAKGYMPAKCRDYCDGGGDCSYPTSTYDCDGTTFIR